MRIHITGNAGAGKTTLAHKLGERLGSPVIHLDHVVWQSGWKKVPQVEKDQRLRELTLPATWLIEGVSGVVRRQADLVVFLDLPRRVCLWRCAKRNWRYMFRSRPELPENCPEYLIVPRLLEMILKFPSLVGAQIYAEARGSHAYVVITRQSDLDIWLEEFISGHVT